jgi:hypothetical protein
MDKLSTLKTIFRLQVMLEQSIKLQCRIIAAQDRKEFDAVHKEALKEIEKLVVKIAKETDDNK